MSNCNHDPQHMRADSIVTRKDWRRSPLLSSAVALTLVASMMPTPAIADSSTAESTTTASSTQDAAETSTTESPDAASPTTAKTSDSTSSTTDTPDRGSASTGTGTTTTEVAAAPAATTVASTASNDGGAAASTAATKVTVSYNANGGSFASGVKTSATGAAGSTITLPTATDVSLVDNKGRTLGHLAGWSTRPNATAPDYQPGSSYVISDSNVTLYAVWYETLTLAPTLENLNGYYMVVDAKGNILKDANTGNSLEGDLSGAVSFTLPRINTVLTVKKPGDGCFTSSCGNVHRQA